MVTEAIAHVKTDQDSTHMIDYEFTLYITVQLILPSQHRWSNPTNTARTMS